MLKASSSMSDSVYDPYGNRYNERCYFRMDFTKARSCYGETVAPLTAKLIEGREGALTWAIASIEESTRDRLIALIVDRGEDGISVTEAASELNVGHWEIIAVPTRLLCNFRVS
jgi:hypothetical protein